MRSHFHTFVVVIVFIVPQQLLANSLPSTELNLLTRSNPGAGSTFFSPWVVTIIMLVVIGVLVVALWPSDNSASTYARQRRFARVEQLFFKVIGRVLSEVDSESFVNHLKSPQAKVDLTPMPSDPLIVIGLSVGGCSVLSEMNLKKGQVVILKLDTLPDFPSSEFAVAMRIIWVRDQIVHGRRSYVGGGKFIFTSHAAAQDDLRKYLNYLLNEPAN